MHAYHTKSQKLQGRRPRWETAALSQNRVGRYIGQAEQAAPFAEWIWIAFEKGNDLQSVELRPPATSKHRLCRSRRHRWKVRDRERRYVWPGLALVISADKIYLHYCISRVHSGGRRRDDLTPGRSMICSCRPNDDAMATCHPKVASLHSGVGNCWSCDHTQRG